MTMGWASEAWPWLRPREGYPGVVASDVAVVADGAGQRGGPIVGRDGGVDAAAVVVAASSLLVQIHRLRANPTDSSGATTA